MSAEKQCPICGADLLHTNKEMCKNFHQQPTEKQYIITEIGIGIIKQIADGLQCGSVAERRLSELVASIYSREYDPDKPRPPCEECIYQAQAAQFQRLAADIWGVSDNVKKENTPEFMQYFRKRMEEFEERYELIRKGAP